MRTFVVGDVHGRSAQLRAVLESLPRAPADTLVLLGDLVDRGEDAPGVVAEIVALKGSAPERVVTLRGNHEQMLLDFIDDRSDFWLTHVTGCEYTFEQYTGIELFPEEEDPLSIDFARQKLAESIPAAHVELFRAMPLYYEDHYAFYVHAGLDGRATHPREMSPDHLLWSRSPEFFRNYHGKPCLFGHTPTQILPIAGRLGHHGVYMSHSAVGIDTSGHAEAPLSCLSLPDFTLYQSFPGGQTVTHHLTSFLPDALRALQKAAARMGN